ncbi:MAG: hypothetical protein K0S53_2165 [Bacteroidetes bacterium]|jgi:hypothetical protein|nr:hypothetical protein [Bacteroidota bacterium]MDF2453172.1 hypothetical protein [Bacteroidota bacterium]
MTVLNKLASTNNIRTTEPNKELASVIIKSSDKKAIQELVENLNNKDKNIQSDCIKVLYEIGEQIPELIAEYDTVFLELLDNKNNRLVWGAMIALDCIAAINPKGIYAHLPKILDIAEKGSVITKDHGVGILTKLASQKTYEANALTLLLDMMKGAATNQLPKYAEDAIPVITEKYKKDFVKVLSSRLPDFEKETKKTRLQKVIKKLS